MAIGILGHVGNLNHGDECIISSLIQNFRRLRPDCQIIGFTLRPEDMERRHGIVSYPTRRKVGALSRPGPEPSQVQPRPRSLPRQMLAAFPRAERLARRVLHGARAVLGVPAAMLSEAVFLAKSLTHLRSVDLLVIAGSEQISDAWGGPWGYPLTLMKWCLLARLRGARVAYVSVGSTPLTARLSRLFHGVALRGAAFRSYRDEGSKKLVSLLAPVNNDPVVPDLAFSFDLSGLGGVPAGARPRVLINPMSIHTGQPPLASAEVYQGYVKSMARLISWLWDNGHEVEIFITQQHVDPDVVASLQSAVFAFCGASVATIHAPNTALDAVAAVSRADYVVGTRFHGVLFSLMSLKPVIAVAYRRKTREVMSNLGQGDFVLDAADCTFERLRDLFLLLEARRDKQVSLLAEAVPRSRAILERQYHVLLALAEGRPASEVTTETAKLFPVPIRHERPEERRCEPAPSRPRACPTAKRPIFHDARVR